MVCDQMYADKMVIIPAMEAVATVSILEAIASSVTSAKNPAANRVNLYRVLVVIGILY